MRKYVVYLLISISAVVLIALGFVRQWPHDNIFGSFTINTYEVVFGCWQGDVRHCDLDPFSEVYDQFDHGRAAPFAPCFFDTQCPLNYTCSFNRFTEAPKEPIPGLQGSCVLK